MSLIFGLIDRSDEGAAAGRVAEWQQEGERS